MTDENWEADAKSALLPKDDAADALGGDLITAGITNATKLAGGITAVGAAAGTAALTILKPFFDNPEVAIAAAIMVAAAALAIAAVLAADLRERAKVTVARFDSLEKLASQQLAVAQTLTAATPPSTPAIGPSQVFAVPNLDVMIGRDDPRHLVALGWTAATTTATEPQLTYLVTPAGDGDGNLEWLAAEQITQVTKASQPTEIDKAEITNIVRVHHVDHA